MTIELTIVGNLTADPELRFTSSGKAVANFTVAHTERVKEGGEWKDGAKLFLRCSLWGPPAENLAESLTKGTRVVVTGRLKQREFETSGGDKRSVIELEADEVGPSLRYARAKVERQAGGAKPKAPDDDPWGAPAAATDDEPPW